jgi:hypothetical protein
MCLPLSRLWKEASRPDCACNVDEDGEMPEEDFETESEEDEDVKMEDVVMEDAPDGQAGTENGEDKVQDLSRALARAPIED